MFSKVKRNHKLWFLVCSDPPCQQTAYTCISTRYDTKRSSRCISDSSSCPETQKGCPGPAGEETVIGQSRA